jgi:hypothetical protein
MIPEYDLPGEPLLVAGSGWIRVHPDASPRLLLRIAERLVQAAAVMSEADDEAGGGRHDH